MKVIILGISMFITGLIGFAILCGFTVSTTYTTGSTYYLEIWRLFGITKIAVGFFLLGIIGLVVAILGVFFSDKSNK